jgi:hypothetical protein
MVRDLRDVTVREKAAKRQLGCRTSKKHPPQKAAATNAGIGVVYHSDTNGHEMYFPMMAERRLFVAAGTSFGSVIKAWASAESVEL